MNVKKLFIGLFVFSLIFISSEVQASFLGDALSKIQNFNKEVLPLRSRLKATALDATASAPTLTVPTVTNITSSAATFGINITSLGDPVSTIAGVCYKAYSNTPPSITDGSTCLPSGVTSTGVFIKSATGLTSGMSYSYRGYVTNANGTVYSDLGDFSTLAVPVLTTPTVTDIRSRYATLGANVISFGNPNSISIRGTCFGTTPNPTTNCSPEGKTITGVFTQYRDGLLPGTTYYYRGYAVNAAGTGYSSSGTFTTLFESTVPTVTSPTATNITETSAVLGANVTFLGVPAYTYDRGICYDTYSESPSLTSGSTCLSTTNTLAAGVFTIPVYSLTPGVTYSYRGYDTNAVNTSYSPTGKFTTLSGATTTSLPVVLDPVAKNITKTSATISASLNFFGLPVSSVGGLCFGITQTSMTDCGKVALSTLGSFSRDLSGLLPNTTYYFNGSATNTSGTSYSPTGKFTTLSEGTTVPLLTVANLTSTNITPTTATLGAYVYSSGSSVSAQGFCYIKKSESVDPSLSASTATCIKSSDVVKIQTASDISTNASGASGTLLNTSANTFSSIVYGLIPNTTYSYRGYATNTSGTSYSVVKDFTTSTEVISRSIAVVFPNNIGESFNAGSNLDIKWETKNTENAAVDVYVSDGTHKGEVVRVSNSGGVVALNNSESTTYTLGTNLVPGSNYKAYVSLVSDNFSVSDSSDNSFTIKPTTAICDYPAPTKGCTYVNGQNYNPTTKCGMILYCPTTTEDNGLAPKTTNTTDVSSDKTEAVSVVDKTSTDTVVKKSTSPAAVVTSIANKLCVPSSILNNLKVGSKGAQVKSLQIALSNNGFLSKKQIDGSFGSKTTKALKEFQAANGLTEDGQINSEDKNTINSIVTLCKKTSSTVSSVASTVASAVEKVKSTLETKDKTVSTVVPVTLKVNPNLNTYYRVTRCSDGALYETDPLVNNLYSIGNGVKGDAGDYYVVTGSSTTSMGLQSVKITNLNINGCPR